MSLSWTFLTKSFLPLRYRDTFAALIIVNFASNKWNNYHAEQSDNHVMTQLYIHDESDIAFKDVGNMHDGAVRRTKAIEFANRVKLERAKQERELMLDAFNYLNNKTHEPLGRD